MGVDLEIDCQSGSEEQIEKKNVQEIKRGTGCRDRPVLRD